MLNILNTNKLSKIFNFIKSSNNIVCLKATNTSTILPSFFGQFEFMGNISL